MSSSITIDKPIYISDDEFDYDISQLHSNITTEQLLINMNTPWVWQNLVKLPEDDHVEIITDNS